MSWFEKFDISIDVVMGKQTKTLKGISYDDRELHNLTTIGKMFSELYNRITALETELNYERIERAVDKYRDIYDYIDQNNMKHYIFKGDGSNIEKTITSLLHKTFNNIRCIFFNENFATYKTAGEYNFNTPICLSELIEKLEEYNKELQDEKNRNNRE